MLPLFVWIQTRMLLTPPDPDARRRARASDDRGQTTAEYALMLLGAATVALLLIAWATQTNKITRLLDGVVDAVLERVS